MDVLFEEPEAEAFERRLMQAGACVVSPINLWEIEIRARTLHGEGGVTAARKLATALNLTVEAADEDHARIAIEAARRFGKGTPARLNLGDCFAYALARTQGDGLLFKGDDFARTDAVSALDA